MSRFLKIIFGFIFLPYGGYLVWKFFRDELNYTMEDTLGDEKINKIQSPDFKKIWDKKNSELIKLTNFLLNKSKGQWSVNEVLKNKSSPYRGYSDSYIKIRNKNTWFGISISDISHDPLSRNKRKKIEFIGNKPVTEYENLPYYEKCYTESETGTVFKIKEKKRLNWILKNLDKSDFGITEFIENENKKVVSKKKNIKSFFNKNMSNLEGKDYDLLLKKYQTKIVQIDRKYIKKFVKISNYLKTKKLNILSIYDSVNESKTIKDFDLYEGFLKNEIYLFNLVLFNSLKMIVSLIEDEMITFYEIYDMFDKLNIFDSNWEVEVSKKLYNIENKLEELIISIDKMNMNLTLQLQQISLGNEKTNRILSKELKGIKSSIDSNGFLQLISSYQLYKINKNTKSLR